MQSESAQTIQELIDFCEARGLSHVATGLKSSLGHPQEDNREKQTLKIIKAALLKEDKVVTQKQIRDRNIKKLQSSERTLPNQKKEIEFNKEQNEEIMENLMNKIVAKPTFINDDRLNAKIEKIFGVESFQKMVDNADVFQDLSNSSLFNQSDFLQRSVENTSFQKMLPSHSQMREDEDPEDLPRFGQEEGTDLLVDNPALTALHDEINDSVDRILADPSMKPQEVVTETVPTNTVPAMSNDDSFSNLQVAQEEAGEPTPTDPQLSVIEHANKSSEDPDGSSFFQNKSSFVFGVESEDQHSMNREGDDEYIDDDDPGFETYQVNEENFVASCRQLAGENNFPARAIKPDTPEYAALREKKRQQLKASEIGLLKKDDSAVLLKDLKKIKDSDKKPLEDAEKSGSTEKIDEDDGRKVSILPKWIKFMPSNDEFYPAEFDNVIYDCYNMRVVFDREKTGFEETKDFPIVINSIVAGRYQVVEYLGSAAFSKAIQCYDIHTEKMVCMKIIENNKDYFDQSVDEIKLLRYINANCADLDEKNLLKLIDFFYHKEHLFIVTELLRDNLYEYSKYNREVEKKQYFNIGRLQKITKQILNALAFIHDLKLIHCDLKPENILIKSYSRCEIKVIDFGSSCFIHDHLSSYVQSRSYRAPEVILGCKYDYKIDIWSLGCILAELFTGYVLFQNDSVQGLLSRVIGIIGPVPEYMMKEGRLVSNFFTREGLVYQEAPDEDEKSAKKDAKKAPRVKDPDEELKIHILVAKKTTLKKRLGCSDQYFVDFVRWLLEVDPVKRPTAKEALQHPWLADCQYEIEDQ